MKQRIISSVIGLAVLRTVLYQFNTIYFNIVAAAVFLIAVYEVYNAFKDGNSKIAMICVGAFGFLLLNQQYLGLLNGRTAAVFFMTAYAACTVFGFHHIDIKTVSASVKQVQAIEIIRSTIGLQSLDENLFSVAEGRLADKNASMQELADRLHISKSCLNHRFRKIMDMARQLGEN